MMVLFQSEMSSLVAPAHEAFWLSFRALSQLLFQYGALSLDKWFCQIQPYGTCVLLHYPAYNNDEFVIDPELTNDASTLTLDI